MAYGRMDRADSAGAHGPERDRSSPAHNGMESSLGALRLLQLDRIPGCPMGILLRKPRGPEDAAQCDWIGMVRDETAALAGANANTGRRAACGHDLLSIFDFHYRKQAGRHCQSLVWLRRKWRCE